MHDLPTSAEAVWLEPGSFADPGGWELDTQFIECNGTANLLAHGLGIPVRDAVTTVRFPRPGRWRVWVYTRDWVAPWKPNMSPGLFRLSIGSVTCAATFGNSGCDWHWQDGGVVEINPSAAAVRLHDLTGFEGRCGAILFCQDTDFIPPAGREALLSLREVLCGQFEEPIPRFDLVVAGGGIAGMTCALQASRRGLRTALVQDRPVFGGNNSAEVRVWLSGRTRIPPYPGLGRLVDELDQKTRDIFGAGNRAENYEDDRKRRLLDAETNLTLYPSASVIAARSNSGMNAGTMIKEATLYDVCSGRTRTLAADLFADCTGDAVLGAAAGARYEMTTSGHMELSNFWNIADTGSPEVFPRCPWALDIGDADVPGRLRANGGNPEGEEKGARLLGCWNWGSGFEHEPIGKAEYARDTNVRAMYGVWDVLKNVDGDYANYKLAFSAYIAGKRESRRLLGDVLLTKDDFLRPTLYDDGLVGIDWHLDLHTPNRRYYPAFVEGDAFLASSGRERFKPPYFLPYRCLYSANIRNLFMAGRCISVTHDALGPVRVMRTCGIMGEVIGEAAYLCRQHQVLPHDIYHDHLEELKAAFRQ